MSNIVRRGPKIKRTSRFSGATFEGVAEDLKSGRMPLKKTTIVDDVQVGLRAIIRESGEISFHVQYTVGDSRPMFKIGDYPDMHIPRAREIAKTIIELGKMGIDVQENSREKLVSQIEAKGVKFRP